MVGLFSFFLSFFLSFGFSQSGPWFFFHVFSEGARRIWFPHLEDDVCRGVKGLFVEEELFITDSSENKSKEDRGEEHGRQ